VIYDQPLAVGNLILKNRLVMVPIATGKAGARGQVTQTLCDHYAIRARGGYLGLVECGHHFVCEEGRATARQASIAHDEDVEGLKREAAAVHDQGTPVFVQLSHAGSAATERLTGTQPLAPSAVTCPGAKVGHPLPRAMSADDIARLPELFSAAARRAHAAGFDGVEIHAAHGYLLDQFLSPLTNLRKDAYGGSLENRARLLVEVLRAVRAELPSGYPVSVRLGGCDYMSGGNTIDDAVTFARIVEAASPSRAACATTAGPATRTPQAGLRTRRCPSARPLAFPCCWRVASRRARRRKHCSSRAHATSQALDVQY
jgi:2,4-dienoyl-CoA reductase-like NADH-dependent reductase (Old Yellow Enzyme family)